jgi:hypothetical protein
MERRRRCSARAEPLLLSARWAACSHLNPKLHERSRPKRVRHKKFGDGTVVSVEGTGDQQKLVIDFATGRKELAASFVEVIE